MKSFLQILSVLLITCGITLAQENFNLELVSNVQFEEAGNDIWGYVDDNGIEYAIMGTRTATRIYSLEDPANPIERAVITGAPSVWRDIKSWKDHLYVTTDQGTDGLTIIDMSGAPDNITSTLWSPILTLNDIDYPLFTCHNLYIDEGFCYLAGCNVGNGGIIMLDIDTDPKNPSVVGYEDFRYAHDVYVRGNMLYSSEINQGNLSIYDITDKANPSLLGSVQTSTNFTHNAWLSDDGNTIFTTDERGNAFVDSYDISDPTNIKRLDTFRPLETEGEGVIPHNTHYYNGFLVTSWYTDGLVIVDATKPDNMVKVAAYDTWLGDHGGFSGCWGAYPYLPSGLILASDINSGLYVFDPTYVEAARYEGTVTDLDTDEPIFGVEVTVVENPIVSSTSDQLGIFKGGQVEEGMLTLEIRHPEYFPRTEQIEVFNGLCTQLNIRLERLTSVDLSITTVEKTNNSELVPFVQLVFKNDLFEFETTTGIEGQTTSDLIVGTYDVYAAKWGYLHKVTENFEVTLDQPLMIEMEAGYQDDFFVDQGWSIINAPEDDPNDLTGVWELVEPVGTSFNGEISNVNADVIDDIGSKCYVTGNSQSEQEGAGTNDVDDGVTTIISPVMDLTSYDRPVIVYNTWFYNAGGNNVAPNDELIISVTNGSETVIVERITESNSEWRFFSQIDLNDVISVNDQMQLIVETSDMSDSGHLVEAGFDKFFVSEGLVSSTNDLSLQNDITISPNPVADLLLLDYDVSLIGSLRIEVIDLQGRQIIESSRNGLDVSLVKEGFYIVNVFDGAQLVATKKMIKG